MNISYKDVEAECNELHNLAKNMKKISEDIASMRDKLNGSWKGIAANAYIDLLNNVTYSFDSVFVSIESSILYMASCAEGYQALDKLVMDEICGYLNIDSNSLLTPVTINSSQQAFINEDNYNNEQNNEQKRNEDKVEILKSGDKIIILDGDYKGKYATILDVNKTKKTYTLSIETNGEKITTETSFTGVSSEVIIIEGKYKNMVGRISDIDDENKKITLMINIFGNDSTLVVDMSQVSMKTKEVY